MLVLIYVSVTIPFIILTALINLNYLKVLVIFSGYLLRTNSSGLTVIYLFPNHRAHTYVFL